MSHLAVWPEGVTSFLWSPSLLLYRGLWVGDLTSAEVDCDGVEDRSSMAPVVFAASSHWVGRGGLEVETLGGVRAGVGTVRQRRSLCELGESECRMVRPDRERVVTVGATARSIAKGPVCQ